jgi:hypothetical protein
MPWSTSVLAISNSFFSTGLGDVELSKSRPREVSRLCSGRQIQPEDWSKMVKQHVRNRGVQAEQRPFGGHQE